MTVQLPVALPVEMPPPLAASPVHQELTFAVPACSEELGRAEHEGLDTHFAALLAVLQQPVLPPPPPASIAVPASGTAAVTPVTAATAVLPASALPLVSPAAPPEPRSAVPGPVSKPPNAMTTPMPELVAAAEVVGEGADLPQPPAGAHARAQSALPLPTAWSAAVAPEPPPAVRGATVTGVERPLSHHREVTPTGAALLEAALPARNWPVMSEEMGSGKPVEAPGLRDANQRQALPPATATAPQGEAAAVPVAPVYAVSAVSLTASASPGASGAPEPAGESPLPHSSAPSPPGALQAVMRPATVAPPQHLATRLPELVPLPPSGLQTSPAAAPPPVIAPFTTQPTAQAVSFALPQVTDAPLAIPQWASFRLANPLPSSPTTALAAGAELPVALALTPPGARARGARTAGLPLLSRAACAVDRDRLPLLLPTQARPQNLGADAEIVPVEALAAAPRPDLPGEQPPQQVRLEFTPPELGTITLQVETRGREVAAQVVVDQPLAADVMRQSEGPVRLLLHDQGLQVESFEVGYRQPQHHQAPEQETPLPASAPRHSEPHRPAGGEHDSSGIDVMA